ncbi:15921_t:CDS:10, partial [Cetraspora pellucida]
NLPVDEFIRKAQLLLSYSRYPEWIPYNYFTEIKYINKGEFVATISAKWSQGAKRIQNFNNKCYYIRSDPCSVVLRKFMKLSLLTNKQLQDRSDCCCLYGITQNPSTLEYMFVEPKYLCYNCLHRVLKSELEKTNIWLKTKHIFKHLEKRIRICPNSLCQCEENLGVIEIVSNVKIIQKREFANWSSENLQIDEFIRKAQQSLPYSQYFEWIPYSCFTEIKDISRGAFGKQLQDRSRKCTCRTTYLCDSCLHRVLKSEFSNWSSGNLLIVESELGAIISAKWSQGAKRQSNDNERYYIRSDPCAVFLKKFINQSLLIEKQLQDRSDYLLKSEFSNWPSGNLLIDEFVRKAQRSLPYSQYPEWIPYNYFTEIKYINRSELGAIISEIYERVFTYNRQLQDRSDCCCLYGITQNPSTLEYMLVLKSEFSNWTSENLQIDGFIQQEQIPSPYIQFPEWIPYDSLTKIESIGRGGFGAIYSARWGKGIKWWKRLVHLFLKEIQAQFNCCHLYGVTKNPSTLQYMFVMRYASQGDLRRFLQKNFDKLTLENKLSIAQSICIELQNIHNKGWVHGDLHILLLNEEDAFISDFGLCRPVNKAQMAEKKLYGVIPNMAPEMLCCQSPYSQASDIYSLGTILWELACGIPAFSNRVHDVDLITDICDGLRPKTCHFVPPTYNDMLRKCWDQNPLERPTIAMDLKLNQELLNSHNATIPYNLMKRKPDIPVHRNAV